MKNWNQGKTDRRDSENDLDLELDAALAKYASVEPRAGLEQRLLANLRSEQAKPPGHRRLRWGVAMALASILVVAAWLVRRSSRPTEPVALQHASAATQSTQASAAHLAPSAVVPGRVISKRRDSSHRPGQVVIAAGPKLDRFPSPQPLTEQEKILADYVAQFHRQAVLLARVTNEELERDRMEVFGRSESPSDEVVERPTTNQ